MSLCHAFTQVVTESLVCIVTNVLGLAILMWLCYKYSTDTGSLTSALPYVTVTDKTNKQTKTHFFPVITIQIVPIILYWNHLRKISWYVYVMVKKRKLQGTVRIFENIII